MKSRAARYIPDAGDLVKVDFDPQAGREQAGWRPALVLSPASYNAKSGLLVAAPVTNQVKGYPFEVLLPQGMKIGGVVLSDHLKSLDWNVRNARYIDKAPVNVLRGVRERVALLLGLAGAG